MPRRHWWSREPAGSEKPAAESGQRPDGQMRRELGAAVGGALRVSWDALAGVRRPKTLRHDTSRLGDRARAAVLRDREQQAAVPRGPSGPAPSETASVGLGAPEGDEPADALGAFRDEPIRTRTMARLYAQQGHAARALRIYEYLLAQAPDSELEREAAEVAASSNLR